MDENNAPELYRARMVTWRVVGHLHVVTRCPPLEDCGSRTLADLGLKAIDDRRLIADPDICELGTRTLRTGNCVPRNSQLVVDRQLWLVLDPHMSGFSLGRRSSIAVSPRSALSSISSTSERDYLLQSK
jgi:hypothetical protein